MPIPKILPAAAALLLAASASAWAINKCEGPQGKAVFQDAPCAGKGSEIEVKPASGTGTPKPAAVDAKGKPMTEAERIEANTQANMRDSRKRELTQRIVPNARAAVYAQRADCERRQAALRDDQYAYRQNLYGKTHAAQRASELAALSAQCDTKDRELVGNFNTLLTECTALGGCAGITP